MSKNQSHSNKTPPREVPTREDPGKTNPDKDPNFRPDKSNPIDPETDDPK